MRRTMTSVAAPVAGDLPGVAVRRHSSRKSTSPPNFELDTRTVAATNADKAAARARLADACEDILRSLRARDADAPGFTREDVIAAVREKYEYDDSAETFAIVLGDATRFAKDAEAKKAKGR